MKTDLYVSKPLGNVVINVNSNRTMLPQMDICGTTFFLDLCTASVSCIVVSRGKNLNVAHRLLLLQGSRLCGSGERSGTDGSTSTPLSHYYYYFLQIQVNKRKALTGLFETSREDVPACPAARHTSARRTQYRHGPDRWKSLWNRKHDCFVYILSKLRSQGVSVSRREAHTKGHIYPCTVSWEYLSQKSTTLSSSERIFPRNSSSLAADMVPSDTETQLSSQVSRMSTTQYKLLEATGRCSPADFSFLFPVHSWTLKAALPFKSSEGKLRVKPGKMLTGALFGFVFSWSQLSAVLLLLKLNWKIIETHTH